MFDPNKRLGDDEPETKKKPALVLGIKFNPSKRLGDDEPDGDEGGEAPDADETMLRAAEGLCRVFNIGSQKASAVKSYLEAFCKAADSKPHDEGEHTDESESGEYGEES